jgi:hypothetical protein
MYCRRLMRKLLRKQPLCGDCSASITLEFMEVRFSEWVVDEAGLCRIWDSHSGGYEEFCLLGYNPL